jgi:hypothetical protein
MLMYLFFESVPCKIVCEFVPFIAYCIYEPVKLELKPRFSLLLNIGISRDARVSLPLFCSFIEPTLVSLFLLFLSIEGRPC